MADQDERLDTKYINQMLKSVRSKQGKALQYSDEEIIFVLNRLKVHRFNFKRTADITGVDRKTIKVWYNRTVMEKEKQEKIKEIEADTEGMTIEQLREKYERDAINAKSAILEMVVESLKVGKYTNRTLLSNLTLINESIPAPGRTMALKPTEDKGESSLLQMITKQATIQINNNGPENNRAGGDSKKPAG